MTSVGPEAQRYITQPVIFTTRHLHVFDNPTQPIYFILFTLASITHPVVFTNRPFAHIVQYISQLIHLIFTLACVIPK
jgi:hypothetical protein